MEDPVAPPADPKFDAERDRVVARLLEAGERKVRGFLARLGGGEHVEDVWQEVCARAWRSRARLDVEDGKPESWLLRIAFRAFLDERKKNPALGVLDDAGAVPATDPSPEAVASARERGDRLLGRLDELDRALLLGFHAEGRSIAELGRRHRMPEGTVKSQLHRARARLRAIHQQEESDDRF